MTQPPERVDQLRASPAEPPAGVLDQLERGASLVTKALWFPQIGSTNAEVARLAATGADEGLLVVTDEQTAGRGRQGRTWTAPPGSSLMLSLLLRPGLPSARVVQLPLLVGLALVEACAQVAPAAQVALKWPNDLLAAGRKCAGILVEAPAPGVAVAGMGINVDWRGVARPPELAWATSLTEAAGAPVERWELLPVLTDRLSRRYREWRSDPTRFLAAYARHCATLGRHVRVEQVDGHVVEGRASRISDDGALVVAADDGEVTLHAGQVHHVR